MTTVDTSSPQSLEMPRGFRAALAAATIGVAALAIVTALAVAGPVIAPDEYGYLSNARALVGRGPFLVIPGIGSFPWGYGLLLAPLAAILGSASALHHGALILNALLLAALIPLGVAILGRVGFPPWARLGGALLVATHPSLFTYAHLVFSENLFVPLQALTLFALLCVMDNRSATAAVCLGITLAASPFVRFAGVVPLAAGVAILAALALTRETRRLAFMSSAALMVTATGLAALEGLRLPGFRSYAGLPRTGVFSSALANPALFLQTLAGQFVSFSLSSWLLFPMLVAVAAHLLVCRVRHPRKPPTGMETGILFAAAAALGTQLMSVLVLHLDPHFECGIYARHSEAMLAVTVWGGLAALRGTRSFNFLVLPTIVGLALLSLVARTAAGHPPMEVVAAPALYHPFQVWGLRSVPLVTAIVAPPMAAAWWALGRRWWAAAAVPIVLQLLVGLDVVSSYVVPGSLWQQKHTAHLTELEPLGATVQKVALLETEVSGWTEGPLSYALPHVEMLYVPTADGPLLEGVQVLVASKASASKIPPTYRLVALQWRGPLATWVRRGIDVVATRGRMLHEIALPPDALSDYRASLEVTGPRRAGSGRNRLRVRVTNDGLGYFPDRGVLLNSPWPMAPVRVGLGFRDEADRSLGEGWLELGRPLAAGQELSLDEEIVVPEGAVTLLVRLLQEGRIAFGPERRVRLDTTDSRSRGH